MLCNINRRIRKTTMTVATAVSRWDGNWQGHGMLGRFRNFWNNNSAAELAKYPTVLNDGMLGRFRNFRNKKSAAELAKYPTVLNDAHL